MGYESVMEPTGPNTFLQNTYLYFFDTPPIVSLGLPSVSDISPLFSYVSVVFWGIVKVSNLLVCLGVHGLGLNWAACTVKRFCLPSLWPGWDF